MGNAFILIVIGLLLFYVVISDKFYCIEGCVSCLANRQVAGGAGGVVPSVGIEAGAGAIRGTATGRINPRLGNLIGY